MPLSGRQDARRFDVFEMSVRGSRPASAGLATRALLPTLVMGVLLTLSATWAPATTLQRVDTRELALGSSDIVIGVVEGSHSYWNEARTRILTDVTVRVDQTLKGAPGGAITLTQLGGELDGMRYSIPGCAAFRAGEEALLFVWRDSRGRAQVNGLAQGKFDIQRDPESGVATVQRGGSGFRVRDLRSLSALGAGEASPRLKLDDLVSEIRNVLDRAAAAPSER